MQKNFKKYPLEYSDEKLFFCEDKICQSIGENSHENSYEVLANLHLCKKVPLWNTLFKRLPDIYNGALLFFLQTFICRCVTGF